MSWKRALRNLSMLLNSTNFVVRANQRHVTVNLVLAFMQSRHRYCNTYGVGICHIYRCDWIVGINEVLKCWSSHNLLSH
jgi:hypothetical protein